MRRTAREHIPNIMETFLAFQDEIERTMRVCMPGEIVEWHPATQSCTARVLLREPVVNRITGIREWVEIALLTDVPVQFQGSKQYALTLPLQKGDTGMLITADACIDAWWFSGGIQNQTEIRRHDLSDCFFVPGIVPGQQAMPNISTTAAELRSRDGTEKVSLDWGVATVQATVVNLVAANINITGALSVNGTPFLSHHHTGVQPGSGQTGGVVT